MAIIRIVLFWFVGLWLTTAAATAQERLALVIGNGTYATSPLANPPNDAELTAAALRDAGFDVTTTINAGQTRMKQQIRDFAIRIRNAGPTTIAAFYYAGHGVQVDGRNYLIPVDAKITAKPDLEYESVEAQWVLDMLGDSGAGLSIIILDACRDNPFRSFTRSGRKGLARMDAPRGSLLSYSTAPGDVAADGTGRNSPFTAALATAIRTPGLKIEDAFKQVRREVLAKTDDRQLPWESTSLTGDFYFTPSGAPIQSPPQPNVQVKPAETILLAPQAPATQIPENQVPAALETGEFVPVELSMDDYDGSVELRCYHPGTKKVTSYAPTQSSRCNSGYYRISEGDFFKIASSQ